MSANDWDRKVFRLRGLPTSTSSRSAAAELIGVALNLPPSDVVVDSLAKSSDIWARPPSKVATLRLKSTPSILQQSVSTREEWSIPLGGEDDRCGVLILDVHFKGMTVLHEPDPLTHIADCIAISGLASHPLGSWQPRTDKSFMWIRDAVPMSIPGVRTVIYGYESSLLSSGSFQSINDIARAFVLQLKAGGWGLPSSKPVIFLAHSLGGLVVKDAIVQIADREKSLANILDQVKGAIMFGVPSFGMEQSHLMAMVEGQANQHLVEILARDAGSSYIRNLNTSFEGLSFVREARVLWAYETEESPTVVQLPDGTWDKSGPPMVLVTPESATCHYCRKDRSLTIPINENHSNMVKFGRGDPNLGVIIYSLSELCSSTQYRSANPQSIEPDQSAGHEPRDRQSFGLGSSANPLEQLEGIKTLRELERLLLSIEEMRSQIDLPELDFRIHQIEDPFQDTFKWIFDLAPFTDWLQEGSGLFWIHGKPGSGKSTLMKLIFQSSKTQELLHDWKRGSLEIKAGFFFHYRGTAIQKSFEGVLRSLVLQILMPHWESFVKRYGPTVDRFKPLEKKWILTENQVNVVAGRLSHCQLERRKLGPQTRIKDLAQQLQEMTERLHPELDEKDDKDSTGDNLDAVDGEDTPGAEELPHDEAAEAARQQAKEFADRHQEACGTHDVHGCAKLKSLKQQLGRLEDTLLKMKDGLPTELKQGSSNDKNDQPVGGPSSDERDRHTSLTCLIEGLEENMSQEIQALGYEARIQSTKSFLDRKLEELEEALKREKQAFNEVTRELSRLCAEFGGHQTPAATQFLTCLAAEFDDNRDGLLSKLERILGLVLDQDIIDMDLVLFFDALDEFDGHLDFMSRFLKSLGRNSATSKTRVKVCLSSRPWPSLKEHFSRYPGFALQDHTRNDIEEYAAASASKTRNRHIISLVPSIITKANGVFIWVTLALKVLIDTAEKNSANPAISTLLSTRLQELPEDLFNFYQLIIERISKPNRRFTFALLELLVRHEDRPASANEIHQAVKVSIATTLEEAIAEFPKSASSEEVARKGAKLSAATTAEGAIAQYSKLQGTLAKAKEVRRAIRADMQRWGGGLVEVRSGRDGVDRPQLMHQTVLEFTTGLWFKRVVFSHLADILYENGHSFHLKHLVTCRILDQNATLSSKARQRMAYHAQQSELTTGSSQFSFLYSIPKEHLVCIALNDLSDADLRTHDQAFLAAIAPMGLNLCLKEWLKTNPDGLQNITGQTLTWPLLATLTFSPPIAGFEERRLTTIRMLLENGFNISLDQSFFANIVNALWYARRNSRDPDQPGLPASLREAVITVAALEELATLALDHNQDPNISLSLYLGVTGEFECRPLHVASPALARKLICSGAKPNAQDSRFRTPLDWVLDSEFLPEPARPSRDEKYEMCNILVEAGGVGSTWKQHIWPVALAEFERAGLDTAFLRERLERMKISFDHATQARGGSLRGSESGGESSRGSHRDRDSGSRDGRQWRKMFKFSRRS